jgi:5-methyltetrahydrofolate--homocysteine methyltransferase
MAMTFMERLRNTDDVLVHFGPIPTFLAAEYGYPLEEHVSVWIVDHPEEFQDACRRIYASGHDSIQIGTQSASPFRSRPFGKEVEDRVYELNYRTAELTREVTPEDHYSVGIIGTTTPDFLEPLGNMTYDEVYQGYMGQIKGLVEGKVDVIAVTGNEIEQTEIVIKAIKERYPDIPIIARNIFYAGKKGFRTWAGLDPQAATVRLHKTDAEVIGAACGLMTKSLDTSEWYPAATALLKEIRQGTDKYIMIQPDPGQPQLVNGKTVWPVSPEEMASEVMNWVNVGARIVGGCCGTGLEHGIKILAVLRENGVKSL